MTIAKAVEEKITNTGERPLLSRLLLEADSPPSMIQYIKGNLGLSKNSEFGSKTLSGFNEGVMGDYGNLKFFVFKYDDENESTKWYQSARDHLKSDLEFSHFTVHEHAFSAINDKGKDVTVERFRNYILVITGDGRTGAEELVSQIKQKIKDHQ
jgi:hypothetical protein